MNIMKNPMLLIGLLVAVWYFFVKKKS